MTSLVDGWVTAVGLRHLSMTGLTGGQILDVMLTAAAALSRHIAPPNGMSARDCYLARAVDAWERRPCETGRSWASAALGQAPTSSSPLLVSALRKCGALSDQHCSGGPVR